MSSVTSWVENVESVIRRDTNQSQEQNREVARIDSCPPSCLCVFGIPAAMIWNIHDAYKNEKDTSLLLRLISKASGVEGVHDGLYRYESASHPLWDYDMGATKGTWCLQISSNAFKYALSDDQDETKEIPTVYLHGWLFEEGKLMREDPLGRWYEVTREQVESSPDQEFAVRARLRLNHRQVETIDIAAIFAPHVVKNEETGQVSGS